MQRDQTGQAHGVKAMRILVMVNKGWRIVYGRPNGILLRIHSNHAVIDREGNLQVGTNDGVVFIARDDTKAFADWIGRTAHEDAIGVSIANVGGAFRISSPQN